MATYIALLKWTPQGLQDVRQSPSRLDAARKGFEAAGVTLKEFYMVTGHYDMIAICEAPDDSGESDLVFDIAWKHHVRNLSGFHGG